MAKLKIFWENTTQFKDIEETITIGSDPQNSIRITGERVSDKHCEIRHDAKNYKLIDLVSRYGTYVNGVSVRECQLCNGDTIVIGDMVVTFLEETKSRVTANKRKRSANLDYIDREIMTRVLKLNEPIELGKGDYQDYKLIPLELFREWLGATGVVLGIYPGTKTKLVHHAGMDEIHKEASLRLFNPLLNKFRELTATKEITDLTAEGLKVANTPCEIITRILAIPIMAIKTEVIARFAVEKKPRGILMLFYDNKKKKISPGEMLLAEAMTHQMASSFCNRELFMRAGSDPLTHLYNRGFFEQTFRYQLEQAAYRNEFLSVALIDLDYFRLFNEKFGIARGDEVLCEMAAIILEKLEADDMAARYGGEKFVVLLPRQSSIRAYNWGKTVQEAIYSHPFPEGQLSVSIGIATFPDNAATTDELIKKADQALFRAKFSGRNKVIYYDESLDSTGLRTDALAGVISGNAAKDYANIQMLVETVDIMASHTDFGTLVEKLVDKVIEVTHAERALIFMRNEEDELHIHIGRDISGYNLEKIKGYSTTIPKKVFTTGQPLSIVAEIEGDEQDMSMSMTQFELRTVMCTPLRNKKQKIFGVLYVDSQVQQKQYEISDLIFFEAISKQIALALENAQLHSKAREQERMQHELELASHIQQRFLPQIMPTMDNYIIYGQVWPALEIGGDYFDILKTEDEKLHVCIGDVSGKGMGAGLIMVMVRTTLHSLLSQQPDLDCSAMMNHINKMVHANTSKEMFMSLLIMQLDLQNDTLEYCGAGHEHIIIYREKLKKCEKILTGGLVLGLSAGYDYPSQKLPLEAGDKVFLYTDGATEAQNAAQDEFGLDTIIELVEQYHTQPCKNLCLTIHEHLKKFRGSHPQYDDITLLAMEKIS